MNKSFSHIAWNNQGLVPAIVQDTQTKEVLMMAWMNQESLTLTIESGFAVYWSRSRNKLWKKGEQSGHQQTVQSIRMDCDNDVLLLGVEQVGGIACHTGRRRCFYQLWQNDHWMNTDEVIKSPDKIYTS